jgi:hypothetical protein
MRAMKSIQLSKERMCASRADKPMPRPTGPFSAELVHCKNKLSDPFVTYGIRVTGLDGFFTVQRRYSRFAELRANLVQLYPDLPEMPPKSVFRKTLSRTFMQDRQAQLGKLIAAVVDADKSVTTRALLDFLGLHSTVVTRPAVGFTRQISTGSMDSIEEETDDDDFWSTPEKVPRATKISPRCQSGLSKLSPSGSMGSIAEEDGSTSAEEADTFQVITIIADC